MKAMAVCISILKSSRKGCVTKVEGGSNKRSIEMKLDNINSLIKGNTISETDDVPKATGIAERP